MKLSSRLLKQQKENYSYNIIVKILILKLVKNKSNIEYSILDLFSFIVIYIRYVALLLVTKNIFLHIIY
jgi:hypothetical protein